MPDLVRVAVRTSMRQHWPSGAIASRSQGHDGATARKTWNPFRARSTQASSSPTAPVMPVRSAPGSAKRARLREPFGRTMLARERVSVPTAVYQRPSRCRFVTIGPICKWWRSGHGSCWADSRQGPFRKSCQSTPTFAHPRNAPLRSPVPPLPFAVGNPPREAPKTWEPPAGERERGPNRRPGPGRRRPGPRVRCPDPAWPR